MNILTTNSHRTIYNTYKNSSDMNNVSFKKLELSSGESEKAKMLLAQYFSEDSALVKNKIYNLFKEHLKNEALQKAGKLFNFDDVLQNLWVTFYSFLADIKELPRDINDFYNDLIDKINNFKPDRNDVNPNYSFTVSLNESNGVLRKLSEASIKKPLSIPNEEEIQQHRQKIKKLIEDTELNNRQKEYLELRSQGNPYTKIAKIQAVSNMSARRNVLKTVAKVQACENILPQKYEKKAQEYITEFELNKSTEEVKKWLINNPDMLPQYTKNLKNNLNILSKKLNINFKVLVDCAFTQPPLFCQKPETIEQNIRELVEHFNKEGLNLENYLKACIKQPSLFCQKPKTIEQNVRELVEHFSKEGLKLEEYLKACIKQPSLFHLKLETIEQNVRELVEHFNKEGLKLEEYLKACIKQPSLFCLKPETIEQNVREFMEHFNKEGLKLEDYLKACIKQPQLFCLKPETIEQNVRELVEHFNKEGLKLEDYLKACIKQPPLFCLKPKTIEQNVRELVEYFNKEGLKLEDYLKICIKQPQLFCRKPKTIEQNVRELVEHFNKEGLKLEDYLKACIKQPSLFCLKPETIAKHINAYKYVVKDKTGISNSVIDIVKCKCLACSTSLIYLRTIIKSQLSKQSPELADLKCDNIKPRLKEYFASHPDSQFTITIAPDKEMASDFINVMTEFCTKELKKPDAFIYKIVA